MTSQTNDTKISLIGKDISYIQRDIALINENIKELKGVYVTKEELKEIAEKVAAINLLTDRVTSLEKNKSFLAGGWKVAAIIGGIFLAVIALVLNAVRLFKLEL